MFIVKILDWFNQLNNLGIIGISIGSSLISYIAGSWIFKDIIDYFKKSRLQRNQNEAEKQLEKLKGEIQKDIQAHYFATQMKATSIYKAYPEIFYLFKNVEGALYQCIEAVANQGKGQKSQYHYQDGSKTWFTLTSKMAEHMLFIEDELRDLCIQAKDALAAQLYWYGTLPINTKIPSEEAKNRQTMFFEPIAKIRDLMRPCLMTGKN